MSFPIIEVQCQALFGGENSDNFPDTNRHQTELKLEMPKPRHLHQLRVSVSPIKDETLPKVPKQIEQAILSQSGEEIRSPNLDPTASSSNLLHMVIDNPNPSTPSRSGIQSNIKDSETAIQEDLNSTFGCSQETISCADACQPTAAATLFTCQTCSSCISSSNLGSVQGPAPLIGDHKTTFTCANCSDEFVAKFNPPFLRPWYQVAYLALLNITIESEGSSNPEEGVFYHLQTSVYKYVYSHFDSLCHGHARNCWKSNLAIALSHHPKFFEHAEGQQGRGWWRLRKGATTPSDNEVPETIVSTKPETWKRNCQLQRRKSDLDDVVEYKRKANSQKSTRGRASSASSKIGASGSHKRSISVSSRSSMTTSYDSDDMCPRTKVWQAPKNMNKLPRRTSLTADGLGFKSLSTSDMSDFSLYTPTSSPTAVSEPVKVSRTRFLPTSTPKQSSHLRVHSSPTTSSGKASASPPPPFEKLREEIRLLHSADTTTKLLVKKTLADTVPENSEISADELRECRLKIETGLVLADLEKLMIPNNKQRKLSNLPSGFSMPSNLISSHSASELHTKSMTSSTNFNSESPFKVPKPIQTTGITSNPWKPSTTANLGSAFKVPSSLNGYSPFVFPDRSITPPISSSIQKRKYEEVLPDTQQFSETKKRFFGKSPSSPPPTLRSCGPTYTYFSAPLPPFLVPRLGVAFQPPYPTWTIPREKDHLAP